MISTKLIGVNVAVSLMKRIGDNLKKTEAANKSAIIVVDRWIQKNFESGGVLAEGGSGWTKLAESTVKARERRRSGKANILQDVGWLKSKWHHLATAKMARIRSGVEYGVYHDSDKPRRKLPQRKILPRQKQIAAQLKKVYDHFVKKALRG